MPPSGFPPPSPPQCGTPRDLVASYDRVAERYADTFLRELDHKPFDRALLDDFGRALRGCGRICDLGCGPGHIARFLKDRGADVFGIDLSARMVEVARRLNPDIDFEQGDILTLDLPDESLAGVVAFYSLIHVPRGSIFRALGEIRRVLAPNGVVLLSVHGGEGEIHADDFLGFPVSVDATQFQPEEMAAHLRQAGFLVDNVATREPYEFEFQSTRVYIGATKREAA